MPEMGRGWRWTLQGRSSPCRLPSDHSFDSPPAPVVRRSLRTARAALKRIERNAALRRELDRMDDRMLSDIGVSRAQLGFEIDRDR